jgi:arylsulfatase A-like enzyme
MFTGLYESQHFKISKNLYKLSNKIPVMAEILKDIGYSTFCFTENPWISSTFCFTENPWISTQTGLSRGFDVFFERWMDTLKFKILNYIDAFIKTKFRSHIPLNFWQIIRNICLNILLRFSWKKFFFGSNRNSIGNLEEFFNLSFRKIYDKPYFIFVNVMANHAPYYSTKEQLKAFKISKKDIKSVKNLFLYTLEHFIKINFNSKPISKRKISALKKFYNSSVVYSDLVVRYIISRLKKLGLFQNSYVIITSDHGELLADQSDHYYWTHGVFHSVSEAMIRTPLIIYNPSFKQKTICNLVELKDLFHTILNLTGIGSKANPYFKENKSILYQINNHLSPNYVIGEFIKSKEEMLNRINFHRDTLDRALIPKLLDNIYYIRSKNHKYIRYGYGIEEFYDLIKDPDEQLNILDRENENYIKMKQLLTEFRNDVNDARELRNIITQKEKTSILNAIKNFTF